MRTGNAKISAPEMVDMVDWENTATVAVPAYDILRVLILQRRDSFIEALEAYHRAKYQNISAQPYEIRARLRSLYEELYAAMQKDKSDEEKEKFDALMESSEFDDILEAWRTMNSWLYDKKLIQFDTQKQYDSTRAEKENQMKGMR